MFGDNVPFRVKDFVVKDIVPYSVGVHIKSNSGECKKSSHLAKLCLLVPKILKFYYSE